MTTGLAKSHEVERIYMEQLRNIETSVYILTKKQKQTENRINQLRKPIEKLKKPCEPKLNSYIGFSFLWIISLIGLILFFISNLTVSGSNLFFVIFILFVGIVFVASIIGVLSFFSNCIEYIKSKKNYYIALQNNEAINAQNSDLMKTNLAKANQLMPIQSKINKEYIEAMKIREDLYSINWIPNQYRNISVIYYICDMVLSSNISIEEALKYYLLQEANNKLDEVLQKMERIIENQNEIIMNQAIISAQNKNLIQQNSTIIQQAANIEQNTRLSAEYSRVGATYAEANAYFSLATYLNSK